jgi:hypothetical protein
MYAGQTDPRRAAEPALITTAVRHAHGSDPSEEPVAPRV